MLNEPEENERRLDEPEELRNLTKSKIYSNLSNTYLLPSKESRVITRSYLVSVFTGAVFRVTRTDMLQFESGINLTEQLKASFFSLPLMVEKCGMLLEQRGMPPLGYGPNLPGEGYFTRVLRFVDPWNLAGGFCKAIRNPPMANFPAAIM